MTEKSSTESLRERIRELELSLAHCRRERDALHDSEERLNMVLDATGEGEWDWNAQTGEVHFSTRYCQMLGYEQGDLPPRYATWADLLHPDDRQASENAVRAHLEGRTEAFRMEFRLRTKSGGWKWILGRGKIIELDEQGNPLRILGTHQDISRRKTMEHALKLTQSVIDRASFGCYWISSDSTITYVNAQACLWLGYERDELLGKSVALIDPDYPDLVWRDYWTQLLANKVMVFETTHMRKDGTTFPVEITSNHVIFEGQEYSCAYVRDLRETKKAEKDLRESEQRLRQAVRVAEIGIFDHDHLAGSVYWSPRLREIHGLEPHEPIGLELFGMLVHPEDREQILSDIKKAHDPEGDGFWDVDYRIVRRDGTQRWLTARSQTFFEGTGKNRRPVYTVGAMRDVTRYKRDAMERERLQDQLLQAQKMESVGRLAGGVAHDFNNMLAIIIGHADMLMQEIPESAPHYEDLVKIEGAAQHSANLTRQLLAFARKQTIAPRPLDLNEATEKALKMLLRLIGEDIDVAWKPGAGLWTVNADPSQIDQVLTNLLVNARDAVAENGQITIETGNAQFDAPYCELNPGHQPGRFVMLSVNDNGCGMDRETLDHLFEPFFTTNTNGLGTGLGLATVYGIVKQNDGFINVHSQLGRGTTFKIYLPRHGDAGTPPPVEERQTALTGGTETILLVEDDAMVLNLNRTLLERMGYQVLASSTPTKAVRKAKDHAGKIHLLITDIVMPEMNGKELSDRIKGFLPDLKCLFISGYPADIIASQGVLQEGIQFLQKPATLKDLADKVREVLNGKG